jgi:hypothetical protein
MKLADITGVVLAGAPAGRMATEYCPAGIFMYMPTSP